MGKHRDHRPWWKPGNDAPEGSWAPRTPPEVKVVHPPTPDEVVLVRDGNTVRAVYRRFVRD